MNALTYDTGALLAAEANHRRIWVLHERAIERGHRPVVPAGVLGQAWRGGPQAGLSRLLRGCQVEELTEARARAVGLACARSGMSDIVDASVVIGALARGDLVVTSDPDDLRRIAAALRLTLRLHLI